MPHPEHHEKLLEGIKNQLKDIFEGSSQGVFIYLDDPHFVCNQKMASMLGYASAKDMNKTGEMFLDAFAAEKSQKDVVRAYTNAVEKMEASTIKVTMKKKNGDEVLKTVTFVPICYEGHIMCMHFIS